MGQFIRRAVRSLVLAMVTISPASYATCHESGEGTTAIYRHPTVSAEFNEVATVITGRVTAERNISEPDDPQGYAWTIYTVQVLQTFKGAPSRTVQLLSESTSARFWMDVGQTYLLFIRRSSAVEMAGQQRLPAHYVDNCGNSAIVKDAEHALKMVRSLSKVE